MSPQCSWKAGSDPPVCEVHDELLVQTVIPIDRNAPALGVLPCYVCPVSKDVVNEFKKTKPISNK